MTLPSPQAEDYHVGWICAVHTEYIVACELLDHEFPSPQYIPYRDNNTYTCGRIGVHLVVVACLPKGKYGLTSATSVAKDMVRSFPAISVGLMVGIGGGAPSKKHDIRLGDVVVSIPTSGTGGVLHYEFGKTIQNRQFERTGSLGAPPMPLLNALQKLSVLHARRGHHIQETIKNMFQRNPRLQRPHSQPPLKTDVLYESSYVHRSHWRNCVEVCSDSHIVHRDARDARDDNPTIHYGLIASADRLMKDANVRDQLAEREGVLCFEMEAAGLMDQFPCIVIRGICDYSDTHKNDVWQGYAAATAAAYAKELIQIIPSHEVSPTIVNRHRESQGQIELIGPMSPLEKSTSLTLPKKVIPIYHIPYPRNPRFIERRDEMSMLRKYIEVPRRGQQRRAALYGLSGVGKTQLTIEFAYHYREKHPDHSVLWVHANTEQSLRQSFVQLALLCNIDISAVNHADMFGTVAAWLNSDQTAPWLMVIDNADNGDVLFSSRPRLTDLFAGCEHGAILLTTRDKKVAERITQYGKTVPLKEMHVDQAADLLESYLGASSVRTDVCMLANQLGNLPLALAQAAAYIHENSITLSQYLEMWQHGLSNAQSLLEVEFEAPGRDNDRPEVPNAVAATMMVSLDRLSIRASQTVSLISFFSHSNIPADLILETHEDMLSTNFVGKIGELMALSLLSRQATKFDRDQSTIRFEMHRLVHMVAYRWQTTRSTREILDSRFAQAVLKLSHAFPNAPDKADRPKIDLYLPHALVLLERIKSSRRKYTKDTVTLARKVAEHLLHQGRITEAKNFRDEALSACSTLYDPADPALLRAKCEVAEVSILFRHFERAKSLCGEVLESLERANQINHTYINALSLKSQSLTEEEAYDQAYKVANKAQQAAATYLGKEHEDTIVLGFHMAEILRKQALDKVMWKSRSKLLAQARSLLESAINQLRILVGDSAASTVLGLQYLANVLDDLDLLSESENVSREIIDSKRASLTEDHIETFQVTRNLAVCHLKQQDFTSAQQVLQRLLRMKLKTVGEQHPDRTKALQILAIVYEAKADALLKSLRPCSQTDPRVEQDAGVFAHPDEDDTAESLQDSHYDRTYIRNVYSHIKAAISLKRKALWIMRNVLGTSHPDTLQHMVDTSSLVKIFDIGDKKKLILNAEEAETLQREVLEVRLRFLEPEHMDIISIKEQLAATMFDAYERANPLYWRSGTSSTSTSWGSRGIYTSGAVNFGSNAVTKVSSPTKLSQVSSARDQDQELKLAEIEDLETAVYSAKERKYGKLHPLTLSAMQSLAQTLACRPSTRVRGISLLDACCKASQTALGPEDKTAKERQALFWQWRQDTNVPSASSTSKSSRVIEDQFGPKRHITRNTMHFTAPLSVMFSGFMQ